MYFREQNDKKNIKIKKVGSWKKWKDSEMNVCLLLTKREDKGGSTPFSFFSSSSSFDAIFTWLQIWILVSEKQYF